MLVCKAQSVGIPVKLDRRVQKGIYFLLHAIRLSHKDKQTAVCKFLPWCFWYICWAFPANPGQGCPTHPRQGIRKRKSPWVAPAHPPPVPDGQSRLSGSQQSPSPPLPHTSTQREVIYWRSGPGAVCFALWLMREPQTKALFLSFWAWQLRAALRCVFGGAHCLADTRTEPKGPRQSCATAPRLKFVCSFFGAQGTWQL